MREFSLIPDRVQEGLSDWLDVDAQQLSARLNEWVARPLALGVAGARSGLFLAESIPLLALQRVLGGGYQVSKPPPADAREAVLREVRALAQRDAEHFARGLYPVSLLAPTSSARQHVTRYLRLLADSVRVAARKRARKPREFRGEATRLAEELPDYYRRNFHFQTDGYLSEASADLYEHQVEILFRGLADAMRRSVIPPLKAHFDNSRGRGLRFLELGAGCGTASRFVAHAFPDANITCLDLSHPYLNTARRRLADCSRVAFLQGDATDLDLRDERFDAVYSVFLFHELPLAQRRRALAEARRVLKPGGIHVLVDSLQEGDVPALDWALEEFPREFHEPYFRNYVRTPLEALIADAGFESPQTSTHFLSKTVVATR